MASGSTSSPADDTLHEPGRTVPATGVYNVIHHPGHRPNHPVMLKAGDTFPPCRRCEHAVYLLVSVAPYIFDDEDFKADPI